MKYLSEDEIKEVPKQVVSNFGHAPFTSQACYNLFKDRRNDPLHLVTLFEIKFSS